MLSAVASGRAGADIMVFPNRMTAVIVINSRRPEGMKGLKEILHDAYNAGAGSGGLVSKATLAN